MSAIQAEVLKHMVNAIAEIDPAKLNDREVIAYLAGISETATGMLQLKPDLKAHADMVMDLANRVFDATKEAEARGFRKAIDGLQDGGRIAKWLGLSSTGEKSQRGAINYLRPAAEYLEAMEATSSVTDPAPAQDRKGTTG